MMYRKQHFLSPKVREHRAKVRSVYESSIGQDELFNWLHDLGLFRCIEKDDVDARNRGIKKCEELGLLDENVVRFLIACFFSLPLEDIEDTREQREKALDNARKKIDLRYIGDLDIGEQ